MVTNREGDSRVGESTEAGGDFASCLDLADYEPVEDSERLSKDVVFELLTSPRRRAVICYLKSIGGEATRGELAEHLAAAEHGIDPEEVSAQQRKRLYISLYQVHLPRMAEAEVIEYDEDRGTIELTDKADQLVPYILLDPTEDEDEEPNGSLTDRMKDYGGRLSRALSDIREE